MKWRWPRYVILIPLLALAVLELRYFVRARASFHPRSKPVTDADRADARARLPALEEVSFRTIDGLTLRGFYVPSRNGATVVMAHGLGNNRMDLLPTAEMLARHGYGSLLFDLRAHGESDGDTLTWGDREQRDFAAAVDFASGKPDLREGRIAALGFSIGASIVALEAARDARVRAVILHAIFTSFDDEWPDKWGARGALSLWPAWIAARSSGLDTTNIRPIDHIAQIAPRPILFIAGAEDQDTPVPIVQKVYDAASQPKKLIVLERTDHRAFPATSQLEYERAIVGFLDEVLLGSAASASP